MLRTARLALLAVAVLAAVAAVSCTEEEVAPTQAPEMGQAAPTQAPPPPPTEAPPEDKPTIVFGDLNWDSAQLQDRVAQYLVEKGYGYPTDVVLGATLPPLPGPAPRRHRRDHGDLAAQSGRGLGRGAGRGRGPLGGTEPGHGLAVVIRHSRLPPGSSTRDLDSVDDLKDDKFKALFATAETGGKARLVSCVIGWACEEVNLAQVKGYGLEDHVHLINPGDGAAMNADVNGAYERKEPWLGYQWGTNDPALKLDLVRLQEPEYSDECWFTTKACAYEDAQILIAVHPDMPAKAPDILTMLRNWDFNVALYKEVVKWRDANEGASINDAALWWLKSNADIWKAWVTPEAASAIQAALDKSEIPDGWPDA